MIRCPDTASLCRPEVLALAWLLAAIPVTAADWHQWRGPERDGKSPETGLLPEWPEGGPPLAWTAEGVGSGFSSVAVAGGRIFTMGDLADGQYVFALSEDGGELLWKTRVGPIHEDGRGGPRSTPTTDSDRLYVVTTEGDVVCLEAATGKVCWQRSLAADFDGYMMRAMGSYTWKFSESPLVDGDHVFASSGYGTGAGLVKIRRDGEGFAADEVYFLDADTMQNHHGGLILDHGTVYTGTGHNKGFPLAVDFLTGKVAWGPERTAGKGSSAVAWADGRIYFRFEDGRMILVEATAEGYREHGTFVLPEVTKPSWSHPAIAGGKLYLREQDRLYCYDVRAAIAPAG